MFRFLVTHLPDDRPAPGVFIGQPVQVAVEVIADLLFGLGDKTQAPLVAEHAARRADGKCAEIPNRAQPARLGVEFGQALLTPGEVIEFLGGRPLHLHFMPRVTRDSSMSLVKALRSDFAGVVHAHEPRRMGLLSRTQLGVGDIGSRVLARGLPGGRCDGAQGVAGTGQQPVQGGEYSISHRPDYSNAANLDGILRGRINSEIKNMYLRSLCAIAAICIAAPTLAQEEEKEEGPWAGKATLGYLATSGNTDSTSLNAAFEVSYTKNKWIHAFKAAAINSTEDEVTTAEAYEAGFKSERNFSEHNYLFGQLHWRKDRFSGYDTQFAQTVGYGRRLIDSEKHKLNAEIGAGARQSDLADGTEESETIVRGSMNYAWKISENARFTQLVAVESGSENTYTESVTKLSASVIGNLALVASYTVKNNSEVPVGTENTDTFTALSLEYTF